MNGERGIVNWEWLMKQLFQNDAILRIEIGCLVEGFDDLGFGDLRRFAFPDGEGERTDGTVEAVKTVSDLFLPLSGEIVEFNDDLEDEPEKVNSDPYGEGWMVKIKIGDPSEADELLSDEDYKALIGG